MLTRTFVNSSYYLTEDRIQELECTSIQIRLQCFLKIIASKAGFLIGILKSVFSQPYVEVSRSQRHQMRFVHPAILLTKEFPGIWG